jgi:CheY-like chemotaxis protein
VLFNLLGNAVKFTQEGEVAVSARRLDSADPSRARLRFEVRDTGIGMPPETLAILFSPFTQGDSSTTRKFGGSGLGLSIVKRLVELMGGEGAGNAQTGGRIGVDSRVGEGSTFWFELSFEHQAGQSAPAVDRSLAGRRILVVDDHAGTRVALETQLTELGCQALLAAGGLEALALLRGDMAAGLRVDAALIDLRMPGMDGIALAEKLRENPDTARLPLLALLPARGRGGGRGLTQAGYSGHLGKPVRRDHLLRTLQELRLPSEAPDTARILIAASDATSQKLLAMLIAKAGYLADHSDTGAATLETLARSPYRLLLLDWHLPDISGPELTRQIRGHAMNAMIPIAALVGDAEEQAQARSAGISESLTKPIVATALIDAIKRLTG